MAKETKQKEIKTIIQLVDFIKANPDLSMEERVNLIDNLPELNKKIKELEKFYNILLKKSGFFSKNKEEEMEEYIAERNSIAEEDGKSLFDCLLFGS